MNVRDYMLACQIELQQFWRLRASGQIFEYFLHMTSRNESMYIVNFGFMYLDIISMQTSFAVMTSCDWQSRARLRLIVLEF
jgi:hypothetical protein